MQGFSSIKKNEPENTPSTEAPEKKYPYNLLPKDGKMLCLWTFIPVRLPPNEIINYITLYDIVQSIIQIIFGIVCIKDNHGHNRLKGSG